MRIPELTPLQYLIVSQLFDGQKSTRQIRDALAALEIRTKPSALHRLLRRMCRSLVLEARRQALVLSGRVGWEHCYHVTDRGLALWQAARQFYLDCPGPPADFKPVPSGYVTTEEFGRQLLASLEKIAELHLSGRKVLPPCKPLFGKR
jgi:hypothetical protein